MTHTTTYRCGHNSTEDGDGVVSLGTCGANVRFGFVAHRSIREVNDGVLETGLSHRAQTPLGSRVGHKPLEDSFC